MPVIVRKAPCLADWLAAFCMMAFLCAAQAAGAVPEAVQTGGAQSAGGHGAITAAKRKVALAQFDVANTLHVDDISNIYDGLPLALAQRLEASGEFLAAYTARSIPREAGEAQREAITQTAAESGAQFLVSGMVVNAGVREEKGYLGTSIGGSRKRHIEVELAVYDGFTGNRLLLRRLGEEAQGEVKVGNDKPFGSSLFFETEFGRAINRLIDLAVRDIRTALENIPLSAHIIRVEGKKIYLDAGSDSRLMPGDELVAYVRDTSAPVVGLKGLMLGVTDRAVATVTLTRTQPQFSIGELSEDAAKLGIRAGNIARIDPAEQRNLAAKQIAAQQAAKAEQEARAEAERVKAEQAAQAEAARVKAEQAAQAEAARLEAEKKAQAEAKAQVEAEAKAAKLKAAQEAKAVRLSAAQEARAREKAQAAHAAARAKREAAKAEATRIKAEKKAEAARIKAEKKAQAEADAQVEAEARAAKLKAAQEARAARLKAKQEAKAKAASKSTQAKTTQKGPARMEVRAVAEEDLQRAEAEAAAAKATAASAPTENKKPGIPLKLKEIKP